MMGLRCEVWALMGIAGVLAAASAAAPPDPSAEAPRYRGDHPVVAADDRPLLVAEAEEFRVISPGWQPQNWGSNYYAATLANTFLSRKAYLGAPAQCERSVASVTLQVPKNGRYLVLVRYEAVYRFETQFRVQLEQNGQVKLDRLYGARANPKIWAFRQKVVPEVAWDWGAVENVVWEGHDAFAELQAGAATLRLIADRQPEPAAQRHVDLVLLTTDVAQVQQRIEKENYLPLDGLLTQAGDVFVKVHNGGPALDLTVHPGTEHSPYWVHQRNWSPKKVTVKPGETSDWVEVGSLLDTLNDGQWMMSAGPGSRYALEFGVRTAAGKIESIRRFDNLSGGVTLAYDANTRYTRRIRLAEDVLYDLVAYLRQQPVVGKPPQRTLIYGYTFDPQPQNAKYTAARDEFLRLIGATAVDEQRRGPGRGYIDVRDVPTAKLEEYCQELRKKGEAPHIAVVSLGDEIGLGQPPANDHASFRAWLKERGLKPADLDPAFGDDWNKVTYDVAAATAKARPALYYWSKIYSYRYGIRQLKERTDILRRHLPNAGIGANFSPHGSHPYLGETYHWISVFRERGMTMPWGEDYIWQVPVASQQMSAIMLDMFRAGVRGQPEAKIHFYVMPHWPGNTPRSWRRQFYGALAHGAKVLNLFEFRPVQVAYTENHVSLPAMYQEVRQALHELGTCEDIIQDGQVRPAEAALWFSETADVWGDHRSPFDSGKRCLWLALRHSQMPLDVVVEGDDLKPYKALYLADRHVSRSASKAIAEWVKAGGRLMVTAGGGMWDEYHQPNSILAELLGVEQKEIVESKDIIRLEKQDLPFAEPVDRVRGESTNQPAGGDTPVWGVRVKAVVRAPDARTTLTFASDGSPAAVTRSVGQGQCRWLGFLPGLSYVQPALPKRPVDRGTTDDAYNHFVPTKFDVRAAALLQVPEVPRPVVCSENLVETTVIESKHGMLIPLINWSSGPVRELKVTLHLSAPMRAVSLASGKPVKSTTVDGRPTFVLDLDVADALILRP
ncbi:MAG: beta-galactosidase trimerization domain-containing protein [Gemmataceae bacterium]|nr:beta-galactosidase trimerization domain-containing protein [Gemmataceae bacterium]MDW8265942.1 beta-galactosidase trimerization domain-containing protein [Gemmataceae bacterium]